MTKEQIMALFTEKYTSFVDYISGLTQSQFELSKGGKWSAGQQLAHIVLCVKPLAKVYNMDHTAIAQTFGITERDGRSYEELLPEYAIKLQEGGKAPDRFLPEVVTFDQGAEMCSTLLALTKEVCNGIDTFSEQELDQLQIPHPLLGNLTMREMLYNAIYHVGHHRGQVERSLEGV